MPIDDIRLAGETSVLLDIFLQDDTLFSDGETQGGLTGLVFNSAGLTCYYHRDTASSAVQVNLVTMTVGTFTSSGFKEIDSTNKPGWYQLCLPNTAFASGAKSVSVTIKGATNLVQKPITIRLIAANLDDGVRLGLTSLPNVAAAANGGLPTVDANNSVKMQTPIKKNTARGNFPFAMQDSSGNFLTGLTVTAQRRIDNGSFAACTNSPTEVANGIYTIDLSAADLNGDTIEFRASATGARDTMIGIFPAA